MAERRQAMRRDETATLPHNLEAEKSVIGALLIQNEYYVQVATFLRAEMFFRDAHRRIYRACVRILEDRRPLDLVSLKEGMSDHDLEESGGPAYVASLVDGVPLSVNVWAYAEIVREKWILRQLITDVGQRLIAGSYADDRPAIELMRETSDKVRQLLTASAPSSAKSVRGLLSELSDRIEHRVKHRGQISGLPTGFRELDLYTHGWQPGHLVVVAGQTSFGKSVLVQNCMTTIAKGGGRAVYYSFEMSKGAMMDRLVAAESGVPLTAISWGNLQQAEYAKIATAMDTLHGLDNFEIIDRSSRRIDDLERELEAIKADRGLAAAAVDHFQLMDTDDDRTQALAKISRRLQGIAERLQIVLFVVSQLTLDPKDMHREPQLEDLRECKSLGHDAHDVLMLHPYDPKTARTEQPVILMKLLIRKARESRIGKVWLDFERDYLRFVQAEEPKPAPKVEKSKEPKQAPLSSPASW